MKLNTFTEKSEKSSKKNYIPLLLSLLSICVCATILFLLRFYTLPTGKDIATDVYYHVKLSDMFPNFILMKTFPWTELSIWKTHFYDKELLFHVIIHFIRYSQKLLNLSLMPPFNFIDLFFIFAIFAVYTLTTYIHKLKYSFLLPILLTILNPHFTYRLLLLRPHLLSIIIFGVTLFILFSKIKKINKIIFIFLIGYIYAYSYSSPHILFLPIIAYCSSLFITHKTNSLKLSSAFIAASIIGIALGFTLHPQFPNTFYSWFIQSAIVIKSILQNNQTIRVGQELYGLNISSALACLGSYIFFLINLFLFIRKKNYSCETVTLLILSIITSIGLGFSKRFIEYNIPSIVLLFIYLINTKENSNIQKCPKSLKGIFILFIILIATFNFYILDLKTSITSPYYSFSKWAKNNIPKKSYIAQVNWDTFPYLFFSAPQYRYSSALDPMFTYAAHPEKAVQIYKFRTLQKLYSIEELKKIFESNLLFISRKDYPAALYLNKKAVFFLYQGKDGWLFDLNKRQE